MEESERDWNFGDTGSNVERRREMCSLEANTGAYLVTERNP
jgi:hypothetical protein